MLDKLNAVRSMRDDVHVIVVTRFSEITEACEKLGFRVIRNDIAQEGIASSLRLGLAAADPEAAAMFCVCDQPVLRVDTILAMLDAYEAECRNGQGMIQNDRILAAGCNGHAGNPVIFGPAYRTELLRLTGDKGGRVIMKAHDSNVHIFAAGENELRDVDARADLEALQ